MIDTTKAQTPKFALGYVTMTRGVAALLEEGTITPNELASFLMRHQCGDWGAVDVEDGRENDRSLRTGLRILSAYPYDDAAKAANNGKGRGWGDGVIWVITEHDRSATTVLEPDEY